MLKIKKSNKEKKKSSLTSIDYFQKKNHHNGIKRMINYL